MNNEAKQFKIIILTRSANCGYKLNHANEPFMNITRIEAIKAEFYQIQLKRDIDNFNAAVVREWINKLEKRYLSGVIYEA
ncbi:hypothetical protein [Vibrio cyclitrophicus]|uniref:hypothetical protein n=1 Tax=Vibrio cyclitrophicus TaxID=47951 RepID=UPI0011131BD9|nr:hypothetical protein [Vibrio cyclitrophicus]